MKRLAVLTLAFALGLPAAPAAADTPTSCAVTLDCTAEDINRMTMNERLTFVRAMQSGHGADLGVSDSWRNIEGVITFFRDKGLGAPGTWVSYVDAGIVEGIERGLAIARDPSADDFGNPGSQLWADYITGSHPNRAAHDRAWSLAEQASTEHGVALAEGHGQYATAVEERFYLFSETYRWALRNRPVGLDLLLVYGWLIDPGLAGQRIPFYDWFTDVRESAPSYRGCEMAYGFAQLHPIEGVFGFAGLFLSYVTSLFEAYSAEGVPTPAGQHAPRPVGSGPNG